MHEVAMQEEGLAHQGLWKDMVIHGVMLRSTDFRSAASQRAWSLPAV